MKNDGEVRLLIKERKKGAMQALAAARAGMSIRTARKYERAAELPSQLSVPRAHRTRTNPFAADWPWMLELLERDDALQAHTLFALLLQRNPGHYQQGQLRTLQRHLQQWRVREGPMREVMFPQIHEPGRMMQSDFTDMNSLAITIAGTPFTHLLFHLMLTFSNVESVMICFSETFEALSEGIEQCIWDIGGSAREHRTDNLSAAVSPVDRNDPDRFHENYCALLRHYSMKPSTNIAGCANQNGDVEQSHHRLKEAISQALIVRGYRDFTSRDAYKGFITGIVRERNRTRSERFAVERPILQALPDTRLEQTREILVRVSRFSLVTVIGNRYSVPSRLIGTELHVRIRSESLELYHVNKYIMTLPRLRGKDRHRIDYRHVIWSLVRKPGAFSGYCYREELFPTTVFRLAYDALQAAIPARADREYVRILHRAASVSEDDVATALSLLLEKKETPTFDEVKSLTAQPGESAIPVMRKPSVNLHLYDALLTPGVSA
jgi:hypothetical protein